MNIIVIKAINPMVRMEKMMMLVRSGKSCRIQEHDALDKCKTYCNPTIIGMLTGRL